MCEESQTVTQYYSGSAQRDFLKGELRRAGQEYHEQLPCNQGERSEGAVCSHSVQLGRLIRKEQSEGISLPWTGAADTADAVQSGECRPLYATRGMGWELCI